MRPARIVFFIALALLLFGAFYLVYVKFFFNKPNTSSIAPSQQQTVFQNVSDNTYTAALDEFYLSVSPTDYWQKWSAEKNLVAGDIVKIFPEDSEITLNIFGPQDQSFSGINRVAVTCSAASTTLVSSKSLEYLRGNIDIFTEATKGDLLYSYCLDNSCHNLGKACILVSRDN